MLKKTILSAFAMAALVAAQAQDSTKKATTTMFGSVDAYYRFDFNNQLGNNKTSFTNSNNSFELGMATLKIDHGIGKVTATADLGFGKRAAEFSYNDGGSLASIKQLYITYAPSSKVKFTLGKFATHIGFELVDAIANRNYSMSYCFSYGPFFHTGLKADISLGGKTALMVGLANPTDFSTTTSSIKYAIAQLSTASKNDKFKAYLNYQGATTPDVKFNQFDLVLLGNISSKFAINYDGTIATTKAKGSSAESWSSNALYLNFDATSTFGLTVRGEYFSDTKAVSSGAFGTSIFIPTLSANIKIYNLTIIPELRLDNAKDAIFSKSSGASTKSAAEFILAATYKF
ncbi:MAG: outer membrane beta-barrel protein [Flavobacterium sp.]|nr:outer membrane beta-barrel protein [Flavobacterium sp.]